MQGYDPPCADPPREPGGILAIHVVAHTVDRQKESIDAGGQIRKYSRVVQRVPRHIQDASLGLHHNPDGAGVTVFGVYGGKADISLRPDRVLSKQHIIVRPAEVPHPIPYAFGR